MDRLEDMQTFVRVIEAGSFSAAAERMHIAKSAVSRRVSDLEQRLGVRLLNRTTRRLSLTDSGRAFYERCVRLLADLEEAEAAVRSRHAALRGMLRVAAPLSFGLLHLAPALKDFLCAHPQLELDLDLNDRQLNLVEEGFDMAIRIGALEDSSLIARRLAPMRRIACASRGYLDRYGTPQTPQDLRDHQGLVYSNVPKGAYWSFRWPDGNPRLIDVPVRMRANNAEVLMSAAVAGLGIAVLPTFVACGAIERGDLVPLLTAFAPEEQAIHAVYPPGRHLSQRVRLFADFLAERFGDSPQWDQCLSVR